MEYVEGETLAQLIARLKTAKPDEPTPFGKKNRAAYFEAVAEHFVAVADGLHHAHQKGIIHRDVKPSNLILEREASLEQAFLEQNSRLRILDFGLALQEGEQALTLTGDLVGTPAYMSPEQARRRKITVDQRTDVYSLGATLYELLTFEPPFRGVDYEETLSQIIERDPRAPRQRNARVPADLETIVLKCLRKDPAARYGTAQALAQDLQRFVQGERVEARPEAALERLARRAKRHKGSLVVAAGALLGLVVCGVLAYHLATEAEKTAQAKYKEAVPAAVWKLLRGQTVLAARGTDRVTASILTLRQDYASLRQSASQSVADAVGDLEVAATLVPEPFEAHYYRARGLRLLERHDEALEAVERSVTLEPGFAPAAWLAAELREERNASAPPPEPGEEPAWGTPWKKAQAALRDRQWQAAVDAYDTLLDAERQSQKELFLGSSIELLLGRGTAHLKLRRWVKAQFDFSTAHYLWRDSLEPALLLGNAYHLGGEPEEAAGVFEKLAATYLQQDEARLWIAATYGRLGDHAQALAWHRRIESPPEQAAYYVELGGILLRNLWNRGLFQSSARKHPPPGAARELAELERVVEKALEPGPSSSAALALRGQMLEAEGRFWEANESFWLASRAEQQQRTGSRKMQGTGKFIGPLVVGLAGTVTAQDGTWSEPTLVESVNSPVLDAAPAISMDGRELYFSSNRPPSQGTQWGLDLWRATRDGPNKPFGTPEPVDGINSEADDGGANLSNDGLTLYFRSDRAGGWGRNDLYIATRPNSDMPWSITDGDELKAINTPADEAEPTVTNDGLVLIFQRGVDSDSDLFISTRADLTQSFGNVRLLDEVSTPGFEESEPSVSPDGLTLFFSEGLFPRPGGQGQGDIWAATRTDRDQPFGEPVRLSRPLNSFSRDWAPSVRGDWPHEKATLYFHRCGPPCNADTIQLYQSTWTPTRPFVRGDGNNDGEFGITDAVFVLNSLFIGGPAPTCEKAADSNDDGDVDVADAVYFLNAKFLGGPEVKAPHAECGTDPTPDGLTCEAFVCP